MQDLLVPTPPIVPQTELATKTTQSQQRLATLRQAPFVTNQTIQLAEQILEKIQFRDASSPSSLDADVLQQRNHDTTQRIKNIKELTNKVKKESQEKSQIVESALELTKKEQHKKEQILLENKEILQQQETDHQQTQQTKLKVNDLKQDIALNVQQTVELDKHLKQTEARLNQLEIEKKQENNAEKITQIQKTHQIGLENFIELSALDSEIKQKLPPAHSTATQELPILVSRAKQELLSANSNATQEPTPLVSHAKPKEMTPKAPIEPALHPLKIPPKTSTIKTTNSQATSFFKQMLTPFSYVYEKLVKRSWTYGVAKMDFITQRVNKTLKSLSSIVHEKMKSLLNWMWTHIISKIPLIGRIALGILTTYFIIQTIPRYPLISIVLGGFLLILFQDKISPIIQRAWNSSSLQKQEKTKPD